MCEYRAQRGYPVSCSITMCFNLLGAQGLSLNLELGWQLVILLPLKQATGLELQAWLFNRL